MCVCHVLLKSYLLTYLRLFKFVIITLHYLIIYNVPKVDLVCHSVRVAHHEYNKTRLCNIYTQKHVTYLNV